MPNTVLSADGQSAAALVERAAETLGKVREAVGQAIFGQDAVIEQTLVRAIPPKGNLPPSSVTISCGNLSLPSVKSGKPPPAFTTALKPKSLPMLCLPPTRTAAGWIFRWNLSRPYLKHTLTGGL